MIIDVVPKATFMTVHQSMREKPSWKELRDFVHSLAFLDGGHDEAFTLASGRKSRWFFDLKPVMMHPDSARLIGSLINERLDQIQCDYVGGLELGAVPLTAIVVTENSNKSRQGFMIRKSDKGRGGRKTNNPPGVEGVALREGGRVIILEDVTTTGGSAIKAVQKIQDSTACEVVGVISIVDREEGGAEAFEAAGIAFESLLSRSDISG